MGRTKLKQVELLCVGMTKQEIAELRIPSNVRVTRVNSPAVAISRIAKEEYNHVLVHQRVGSNHNSFKANHNHLLELRRVAAANDIGLDFHTYAVANYLPPDKYWGWLAPRIENA